MKRLLHFQDGIWYLHLPHMEICYTDSTYQSQLAVAVCGYPVNSDFLPVQEKLENLHANINLGPVVQSWVKANPGLKLEPVFWFLYFYVCLLPNVKDENSY